jgi:DNA-binding CsgD family transcriptional regulator
MFASPVAGELFEREPLLAQMGERLRLVHAGQGQILLLSGEAGVGKSTLAHEFVLRQGKTCDVLWGTCDSLFTLRPLGAFDEVFAALGLKHSALEQDQASSSLLFPTLLTKITSNGGRPHLLVIEDIQWADSLSLDLMRYIARRASRLGLMFILTIRADALVHESVLRNFLADLPFHDTTRIQLLPLSRAAICQLAGPHAQWGEALFELSGGNPFYAKAVLEASVTLGKMVDSSDVPQVVRDVVLGRLAKLSASARLSCEFLSVVSGVIAPSFLEAVCKSAEQIKSINLCEPASIEECMRWGLLKTEESGVMFSHDIVRVTIEQSVPPLFSRQCHVIALRVHENAAIVSKEVLLFHARLAKSGHNLTHYIYEAALEASGSGAHRLATSHYETLLTQLDWLTPHQRARVFSGWAFAWSFSQFPNRRCIEMLKKASAIFRDLGEVTTAGSVLLRQSTIHMLMGNPTDSTHCAQEAIDLLEPLANDSSLGLAYSQMAHCCMASSDLRGTETWADKALTCEKTLKSAAVRAHALINLGAAQHRVGEAGGQGRIERGLSLALKHGLVESALLAYLNLAEGMLLECRFESAIEVLKTGSAFATDTGLLRNYFAGLETLVLLQQGKLEETENKALQLLKSDSGESVSPVLNWALSLAYGHACARRSDRLESETTLRQLYEQSLRLGLPRFFLPPGLALVEYYWMDGNLTESGSILQQCWRQKAAGDSPWQIGAMRVWAQRLGLELDGPVAVTGPFALELQGAYERAADMWLSLGVPFEAAICLLHGNTRNFPEAARILKTIGALATINTAKRIARARGMELSQRGPYRSARAHPQGLTAKETHVLEYLKEGFSNADIADQMKRSERTIEHHVAAILKKLRIRNRTDVVLSFASSAN